MLPYYALRSFEKTHENAGKTYWKWKGIHFHTNYWFQNSQEIQLGYTYEKEKSISFESAWCEIGEGKKWKHCKWTGGGIECYKVPITYNGTAWGKHWGPKKNEKQIMLAIILLSFTRLQ